MRPCKGRSDARRESADAEGSRSSEIAARSWRERAADRHHDWGESVDGRRVSAARCRYRHHLAGPEGLDDAELERRLFTLPGFDEKPVRPLPDWSHVHKELKRRAVTLLLLWEEYRAEHADGYGYSRFCDLYRDWCKTISATMRQTHGAAEKLFVDFAGDTVAIFDAAAGMDRRAHIFVAVLGASNYTYRRRAGRKGLPTGSERTSTP